jgi:cellulose synthase/poly-beta-1,6-N-acetylglucosamine synthase-like glycosyltransferase
VGVVFWLCLTLVAYPYCIYPLALLALNRLLRRPALRSDERLEPSVSVILPVHNEAERIEAKLRNLLALDYPRDKMQIIVVGDACTDDTLERAARVGGALVETLSLSVRAGKAAALNAGLERAAGDIVVFTDAAIMLERPALRFLAARFADPNVGCVSGEDFIEGAGTEGLYGRVELFLRREEAKLHSIAGASGCFYGQRRELCRPFVAGMAPDFLSVLVTVRAGKRALAEPRARGSMTATSSQKAEFSRKVRTFQRGLTALFDNLVLLNPLRHPAFSFILWSHKVMRWFAPAPMIGCLLAAWLLSDNALYAALLIGQVGLYGVAILGLLSPAHATRVGLIRVSAFFLLVNVAALKAVGLWAVGSRIEVWEPTRRPS